jgi:uncharacterized phage infection (PIP) family protein YhgE
MPVAKKRAGRPKLAKSPSAEDELQDFLLLNLETRVTRLFHLYKELKAMSTTEAEAITNLQTAVAATDAKLTQLQSDVKALEAAAADNPAKVAALDAVTAQVATQQSAIDALDAEVKAATPAA